MKLMIIALAIAAGSAGAACAAERHAPMQLAQLMNTPAGCQWFDTGQRTQQLWCRDADGRARPTATTRRDDRDPADTGCPRGQLDDGLGCVSEARAVAARGPSWPPLAESPAAYPGRRDGPELIIMQPAYGRSDVWVVRRPRTR
ncbi:MAG: hypothetical protein Q8M88_09045 [Phenylobacterium sp.]|uniref:hypothetical protein n=1 Tax=Phenylobacterium sp. TaxID=1871053 RepID=UPI002733A5FD|nr:hypothetical protein [Phenylobacterium sp.]MDP3174564.1 hypothetical protein [Phenylobacterium sp.]